ncbi:MAG: hypothetical protein M3388_00250 [Acidobacteriota bacterium]|nr:hypothetical protein [Acidobacteriota bacterium]
MLCCGGGQKFYDKIFAVKQISYRSINKLFNRSAGGAYCERLRATWLPFIELSFGGAARK